MSFSSSNRVIKVLVEGMFDLSMSCSCRGGKALSKLALLSFKEDSSAKFALAKLRQKAKEKRNLSSVRES